MENFDWISYDKMMDKSLQTQVVHALSEAGLTLATAESCTGGLIAARITDVSGSSAVFHCGMVFPQYEHRIRVLRKLRKHCQRRAAFIGKCRCRPCCVKRYAYHVLGNAFGALAERVGHGSLEYFKIVFGVLAPLVYFRIAI